MFLTLRLVGAKKSLSRVEKKVIAELRKNAKESVDALAKRCKFSRQKVWRIMKILEKDKTVWGYAAIVNGEKQDLKHYSELK